MKKTHRVVKSPTIPVQYLSDYMASSSQVRRTIVQKCKCKSLARAFQHQIARKTIADHILDGNPLPGDLNEKAADVAARLADTEFEAGLHQHNSDFIKSFAENCASFDLSGFEIVAPHDIEAPTFHGTKVPFKPSLLTYRRTKANTHKIGAIMFRYAKGKPVAKDVAEWQTAFMFGYFNERPFMEEAKPEPNLCMVLCAVSGQGFQVPAKPVYKYNEMAAVCRDISERWENIPPPPNAVI